MTNYSKTIKEGLEHFWIDWCIDTAMFHTIRADYSTHRKRKRESYKTKEYAKVGRWCNRALKHRPNQYQLSQLEQVFSSYVAFFGIANKA